MLLLSALMFGLSAGLRSMTPLAVLLWAAGSWILVARGAAGTLSFTERLLRYGFVVLAVGELIADKLPFVPSRLKPGPLIARICSGALCGALVTWYSDGSAGPLECAAIGGLGGVAGAYAGYHARRYLTLSRGLPDLGVALAEDVLAIGLAVLAVFTVPRF